MITHIQEYYLGQSIKDAKGLTEFTDEEYRMFELAGAPKWFQDEKTYNAPDLSFIGTKWETVIGAADGKIYKIALMYMTDHESEVNAVYKHAFEYLVNSMGSHSEHLSTSNQYIWPTNDGNVLLNKASSNGYHAVNLILTSGAVDRNKLLPNAK
jgi:hypothetical protein